MCEFCERSEGAESVGAGEEDRRWRRPVRARLEQPVSWPKKMLEIIRYLRKILANEPFSAQNFYLQIVSASKFMKMIEK